MQQIGYKQSLQPIGYNSFLMSIKVFFAAALLVAGVFYALNPNPDLQPDRSQLMFKETPEAGQSGELVITSTSAGFFSP